MAAAFLFDFITHTRKYRYRNMSSSLALLQPAFVDSGINVGRSIELALAAKQTTKQKVFQSFNPSTDNFPFLLEESGVYDEGRYGWRWTKKTDFENWGGYSSHSTYQLKDLEGSRKLATPEALSQVGVVHRMLATTRELLGVYLTHRDDMRKFLRHGHRLIAPGSDFFHPHGAAVLRLRKGRLSLKEVPYINTAVWLPSDIFLVRYKDP